ncbi:MAG: hypothetical protein P9E24_09020 [Candidatus Competibacter sp.]|nr:hypothetical protein [Candidatus Competibacter sp.]MDG4582682.1 hypothetical protein [Candidatus Competibacter sp.]
MEEPNLFLICLNAFVAVIGLLAALAGALRGLIELFPEPPGTAVQPPTSIPRRPLPDAPRSETDDTAVAVAIAAAANAAAPGARVTHIEEIR